MVDILKTTEFKQFRDNPPTAVESALTTTTVLILPTQAICIEGFRGGRFQFISNGANDETATWTLYAIDAHKNALNSDGSEGYFVKSLGTLAITLGTAVGLSNVAGIVPITYRYADTCVWTATTYGTARLTYVGGNAAAFSPADNTIAEFLISDFGNSTHLAFVCTTFGLAANSVAQVIGKLDL